MIKKKKHIDGDTCFYLLQHWGGDAEGSFSSRLDQSTEQVPGQPKLCRKTQQNGATTKIKQITKQYIQWQNGDNTLICIG